LAGGGNDRACLAALAVWFSTDRRVALIFVGAMAASFLVLRLVGELVSGMARKSPRVRSTALRWPSATSTAPAR
jgi:putative ABC transport system permease protein